MKTFTTALSFPVLRECDAYLRPYSALNALGVFSSNSPPYLTTKMFQEKDEA